MRKLFIVVATLVAGSFIGGTAYADRPLVSEEPSIQVNVGEVRLDGGATFYRAGGNKVSSVGELQIKTGLTKKSEVFIRGNHLNVRGGVDGYTPIVVGAKYLIAPNFAVIASTSTPTGKTQFRNNYEPGITFAVGRNLRPGTNLIANLGYRRSDNGIRSNTGIGTLAITQETSVGKLFAEVYGTADRRQPETASAAIGISRNVADGVTMDARVGRSLKNVGQPNYFVGVGITILN